MGIIKEKSDRDQARAAVSAGGWAVAWGDLVNEFDVASGVISSVIPAIGTAAWVSAQIQAQIQKFGQSLNNISPAIRDQAIKKVQEIVKNRFRGEWVIGGIGIKAGVATYHRWFKLPIGGWQKNFNNYQPYIGFRITSKLSDSATMADAGSIETRISGSTADSGPTEAPFAPPPSPIGTYEDISLALTEEELKSILEKEGQEPLPPPAVTAVHA